MSPDVKHGKPRAVSRKPEAIRRPSHAERPITSTAATLRGDSVPHHVTRRSFAKEKAADSAPSDCSGAFARSNAGSAAERRLKLAWDAWLSGKPGRRAVLRIRAGSEENRER